MIKQDSYTPFWDANSEIDKLGKYDAPIAAMQHSQEFASLLEEYIQLKPAVTLEIGTYKGGTLWWWLKYAKPNSTIVTMDCFCDNYDFDNQYFNTDYEAEWQTWVPDNINFKFINADSHSKDTVQMLYNYLSNYIAFEGKQCIDFLFIDGDHSHAGVLADYNNYAPFVKKGGIIAFHDIDGVEGGVYPLWQTLKQKYITKEFIYDALSTPGIGVLYV